MPLKRGKADHSKPHPVSYRQEPGENALCYTFGTTAVSSHDYFLLFLPVTIKKEGLPPLFYFFIALFILVW